MKELLLKIKKANHLTVLMASMGALFFGIGTMGVITTPKYEYVLPNSEIAFSSREDLLKYIVNNVSEVTENKYMIEGSSVLISEAELESYISSLFNNTIKNTVYYTNADITFDSGVLVEDTKTITISSELIKGYKDSDGKVQSEEDALADWIATETKYEHKLLNSDDYDKHFDTEDESIDDYIRIVVEDKDILSRTEYHYGSGIFNPIKDDVFADAVSAERTTNPIVKTNAVLNTDVEFYASTDYINTRDNWINDNYVPAVDNTEADYKATAEYTTEKDAWILANYVPAVVNTEVDYKNSSDYTSAKDKWISDNTVLEVVNTEADYKVSSNFNTDETAWLSSYTFDEYKNDINSDYITKKAEWDTNNPSGDYDTSSQATTDFDTFKAAIDYASYSSTDYSTKRDDWLQANPIKVVAVNPTETEYLASSEYISSRDAWLVANPINTPEKIATENEYLVSSEYESLRDAWLQTNPINTPEIIVDEDDYKATTEYTNFKSNWFIQNPNKEEAYWTYLNDDYDSESKAITALENEVRSKEVTRVMYSHDSTNYTFDTDALAREAFKTTIQDSEAEAATVIFYTAKTGMTVIPDKDPEVNNTNILSNLESKDVIDGVIGLDFDTLELKTFVSTFDNINVQDVDKALELYNTHIRENLEVVSVVKYKFDDSVVIFDTEEMAINYYESIIMKVKK